MRGGNTLLVAEVKGFEVQKTLSDWISEHGLKQASISRATGITKNRMSDILTLKSEMKASEMLLICAFIEKEPNDFIKAAQEKEE